MKKIMIKFLVYYTSAEANSKVIALTDSTEVFRITFSMS